MTGHNPIDFYRSKQIKITEKLTALKKTLVGLALLRLVIFISVLLGVYFLSDFKAIVIITALAGASLFLLIVSYNVNLKTRKAYLMSQLSILEKEIDFLENGHLNFENGNEFKDTEHHFANDIDLFGENSLFQYVNRTIIHESKELLADTIGSNDINNVLDKQLSIKELALDSEWRLEYMTKSTLVDQKISHQIVLDWLKNYVPIVPRGIYLLSFGFIAMTIIGLLLYILGVIGLFWLGATLFFGLFISSFFVKRINRASIHLSELKNVFSHYSGLISLIEDKDFESKLCVKHKHKVVSNKFKASQLLKTFSGYLNSLDQRNNILFAVIGNGFFLWDCVQVYKIEKWIRMYREKVKDWFDAIVWFDMQNSFATYTYNHPQFVFPELEEQKNHLIEANALGHFMIDPQKRVDNDFTLKWNHFVVVTGANMAGKSTFLRTVSSSIIMANTGLPVCAESYKYSPVKLVTSMRNTDSLANESSYFFAELNRLKMIVDLIEDEPYFIILDEILKGTNSKDKEEGSIALMQKLSSSSSSGLIATHDLGLCAVEDNLPNVSNQYFDAEIKNDELYFDYTLKDGICQNMNASFLLMKMGIV